VRLNTNQKRSATGQGSWNSSTPKALLEKFLELLEQIVVEKLWQD